MIAGNIINAEDGYIHHGDPLMYNRIIINHIERQGSASFPLVAIIGQNLCWIEVEYTDLSVDIIRKIRSIIPLDDCSIGTFTSKSILFHDMSIYNPTRNPMLVADNYMRVVHMHCIHIRHITNDHQSYTHRVLHHIWTSQDLYCINPGDMIRIPSFKFQLLLLNTAPEYHKKMTSLTCYCIHKLLGVDLSIDIINDDEHKVLIRHKLTYVSNGVKYHITPCNRRYSVHIFYSILCDLILRIGAYDIPGILSALVRDTKHIDVDLTAL